MVMDKDEDDVDTMRWGALAETRRDGHPKLYHTAFTDRGQNTKITSRFHSCCNSGLIC